MIAAKTDGSIKSPYMSGMIADRLHVASTLLRAGVIRPARPDRALRALSGLRRWGPTLAAGYLGAAARYPDAVAIVDELGTLSFEEVNHRTDRLANALAEQGIGEDDAVAILCRNHHWFVEATVACSKLGAHSVYLNTAFAGPQVAEVLERERPVAVIHDQEFEALLEATPTPRGRFVAFADEPARATATLESLIAAGSDRPPAPPTTPGRTVILTSGTTGTPKGANRTSPDSLGPAASFLSTIPLRARETTMIAAPLFHSWGFAHMLLGTALTSALVLRRRFDPEGTLRALAGTGASALVVVPVMLQRILELGPEAIGRYDLPELRVIAASGSALPGPLAQRVLDAFGEKLYNLYGSTEVAWATIATPEDLRSAPGTAGRPPHGTAVKILDEAWRELGEGESGHIFVGGELLFDGYTGGGDKVRHGSLMSTGDVGHFDAAGRLFVDGRDDDMIVSGGENVFPSEVENLLAGLPGIREVAVIGVVDEEFGQRLQAFAVLDDGAVLSERELQEHVKLNLARYKVPREVVFLDELPRNATGKVLRRELVAQATDRQRVTED
jgi:acyl-CoA synthetase (AMP-forming)/AMP-acid ligase II